ILPDEGLIHDRDPPGSSGIVSGEIPACKQRNAHGLKVARTHPGKLRASVHRADANSVLPTASEQRYVRRRCSVEYARRCAYFVEQLFLERLVAIGRDAGLLKSEKR